MNDHVKKQSEDIKEKSLSDINSQTAKNGYKEEEHVCKDLNINLIFNIYVWEIIRGTYKSDIQSCGNKFLKGQVKKYKQGQFQQLDRRWVSCLIETIPELSECLQILTDLFEYPLLPNGTHVDKNKPIKKLCNSNYSQEILDNFLDLLNKYKKQILEYAFLGNNLEMRPHYLFGSEYRKQLSKLTKRDLIDICKDKDLAYTNKIKKDLIKLLESNGEKDEEKRLNKIVVFKIDDIINYLETLDFKISPRKTAILLGDDSTISLQRKGGDTGKKSSNQLQIKLILSNLIDKVPTLEHKL